MTYSAFVALVVEELGVNGNRRGIEVQRARWIRDGVIDLQRFIRAYRIGHTTNYVVADLTAKGYAHLGSLPEQCKPKAFYTVSLVPKSDTTLPDPNVARNRMDYVAWEDRQAMIDARYERRRYTYAISPFSRQFMVHPLVNDESYLLLVWDGMKMDFADGDTVVFPIQAAEAVASYVTWKILKFVDKRIDLAQVEYGAYTLKRLSLWREQNEAQVADGKDEEYASTADPAPGTTASQAGQETLALGAASLAIVFPTAFSSPPVVDCWVIMPDGAAFVIDATPDGSTITDAGFTAILAGPTPATGYILAWAAQPAS